MNPAIFSVVASGCQISDFFIDFIKSIEFVENQKPVWSNGQRWVRISLVFGQPRQKVI